MQVMDYQQTNDWIASHNNNTGYSVSSPNLTGLNNAEINYLGYATGAYYDLSNTTGRVENNINITAHYPANLTYYNNNNSKISTVIINQGQHETGLKLQQTIIKTNGQITAGTTVLDGRYEDFTISQQGSSFKVLMKLGNTTYFTSAPDKIISELNITSSEMGAQLTTNKEHVMINYHHNDVGSNITVPYGLKDADPNLDQSAHPNSVLEWYRDETNHLLTSVIKDTINFNFTDKAALPQGTPINIASYLPMNQVDTIQDKLKVMGINDYTSPTVNKVFAAIVGTYNIELFGDGSYNFETIS